MDGEIGKFLGCRGLSSQGCEVEGWGLEGVNDGRAEVPSRAYEGTILSWHIGAAYTLRFSKRSSFMAVRVGWKASR